VAWKKDCGTLNLDEKKKIAFLHSWKRKNEEGPTLPHVKKIIAARKKRGTHILTSAV